MRSPTADSSRGLRALVAAVAVAGAIGLVPGVAGAAAPDLPGRTPVLAGGAAARSAVSPAALRRGLARQLRRVGGASGAWVKDLSTGRRLFARGAKRRLLLASNMKLFTTGATITRLGVGATLDTSAWELGRLDDSGTLHGSLLLRGNGDPTLGGRGIGRLAGRVKAAGVRRVTGRLVFDDSIFDRRRTVPASGVTGGPYLGSLSGLSYGYGFNRRWKLLEDPARTAAYAFLRTLRKRGIRIPRKPKRRRLGRKTPNATRIALLRSPEMADLIAATNQPSDNFLAEMLTKVVGAKLRGRGTTAAGVGAIRAFARSRGVGVRGENGSGLSRRDRATPQAVGRFLARMRREGNGVSRAFTRSLAVAGRSGTLADRMRGSAAQGRCRAKTGTLTGVSALSGYCFAPGGRVLAFSILMSGVDVYAAHIAQDEMAALIARYRG